MNSPTRSKINYTSLIIALIGLAIALDWVPAEAREPLTEIVMIAGPALIMVWRTWFTEPK